MADPAEEAVIAALWARARERLLVRVETLEAAAAGGLEAPERARALAEAHTLAGTLGAFGRPRASRAARDAGHALECRDREALFAAVAVLRAEIEAG